MSNLSEYFHTDWAALTLHDWIGLILTVAVFCLMIYAYWFVFNPKNRNKLEAQRYHVDADDLLTEDRHDR